MLMGCAGHWVTSSKKKKAILLASVEFLEVHENAHHSSCDAARCPLSGLGCQHEELFHWRIWVASWVPEAGATLAS